MAVRDIIEAPDKRLKRVSEPVEAVNGEIRALLDDMLETMYAAHGIGLAAIQVGEPVRALVIDVAPAEAPPAPRYFINPEIVEKSEATLTCEEGCLSVPEFYAEVERAERIKVRYLDYDGEIREEEMSGPLAVCLQHEIDHLDGILFIDYLSALKRGMILRKLGKQKRTAAVA